MPRDTTQGPLAGRRQAGFGTEVISTGFFASASRKKIRKPGDRHKVQTAEWQREAWRMFDTVGEYHSACTWVSNMISKAKITLLYDGQLVKPGDPKHEAALRALDALYGGPEEQAEMLRLFGLHLSVAGDCYLVAISGGNSDDDWDVYSNLRITPSGDWYKLTDDDSELNRKALVMRMWRKHPLDRKKGDSNSRAAMPILSELEVMTQRVAADSESRLVGAGLLLLPNEVTFPSMQQTRDGASEGAEDDVVVRTGIDGFMDMLIDVASMAIADQSSAVAKVPVVVQMPGDQIAKVKLINFWSDYDKAMKELRAEAIRRLSLALDMPPEVLTGMADANHWTAWQMEEAAIKVHTEPQLKLILSSLTEGYLWPYLDDESMDEDEIRRYSFGADTSEMRLRPNRSKEALELNDRGIVKDEVAARENGFDDDDLMDDADRAKWLMRKVAQGSSTPEMVLAALAAMGADLSKFMNIMAPADPAAEEATPDAPLPRNLDGHPRPELPERDDEAAIAAASEVVVLRVLERAGNRLKNRMGTSRPPGVEAVDLYRYTPLTEKDLDDLLEDAWGQCEKLSVRVPVEHLTYYVKNIMLNAKEHDVATMRRFIGLAKYATGGSVAA